MKLHLLLAGSGLFLAAGLGAALKLDELVCDWWRERKVKRVDLTGEPWAR